ncbi:MAG: hypothetical protein KatS3mg051_1931 [Anaerolineae bacterium]|nr:MAG: hypothetical protein KatS3mg051_1931 [Anaerolineae bacterium]
MIDEEEHILLPFRPNWTVRVGMRMRRGTTLRPFGMDNHGEEQMESTASLIVTTATFNRHAHNTLKREITWSARSGELIATLSQSRGITHISLFDEYAGRVNGRGKDARSAYRAAWRELRLRRYDTAELLRETAELHRGLAELRRALGHDTVQAIVGKYCTHVLA